MNNLTTNYNENQVDLHDLCIDGDYLQLKILLESNENLNLNQYKLFLCRKSKEQFQRINSKNYQNDNNNNDDDDDDDDENYQNEISENYFDYRSPLFCAIIHNNFSCIKLLIQYGANQYQLRPWGLNVLSLSVYCRHIHLVKYFLEIGFNPNQTDQPNSTDRYFQNLSDDHPHKIKMKEMHLRVSQDYGMFHFPIHLAIKQDSFELVQLIHHYSKETHWNIRQSYTKRTSLHLAAEKCSLEIIRLILSNGTSFVFNQLDFNHQTSLDILWKSINHQDYLFEYRENLLKLMLTKHCQFSSIRSLTELNTNSLSIFRRFQSNLWILIPFHLKSLFIEQFENNKIFLVQIWIWFNKNYQDLLVDHNELIDRHYTGSILRNLIHLMYENEQIHLTNHQLVELFTEDLGSHFDKATDEIDIITTILSTPLKLKQICRNRFRHYFTNQFSAFILDQEIFQQTSISTTINEQLQQFLLN